MYWFLLLFPLMIYPWGYDPNYTMPKVGFLNLFVLFYWLYIILTKKYRKVDFSKSRITMEICIIIFICLIVISTYFSVDRTTSLYGFIHRYEGLLAFFSYCSILHFSHLFLDLKKIDKIIFGISFVSIFVSIYGILQHYLLDFLPRNSWMVNYTSAYSFFDNPNFFGSYLVLVLLISITSFFTVNDRKTLVIYYVSICLSFIALIFSNTRSGYLGVFCGLLFLTMAVIFKRKYLWKKWAILIVTLGVILVVINISEKGQYFNRINTVFSDSYNVISNKSTGHEGSSRIFIWKKSLPLIKDYFWHGSGPDTFAYVFPEDKEKRQFFGDMIVDKAHNEYLQIAVTLGVPALLSYFLILFLVLRQSFHAIKRIGGNDQIKLYGLIAVIFGYLVQAFFNISTVPVAPLFWAILGITLAKSEFIFKNEKDQSLQKEMMDKYKSA